MSLTGHLIRSIKSEGGTTTLNNLIQITEPFLPYLRKLNGKNFTVFTILNLTK
jgi:beta-1,4-N-acetylglucosaminyltransferase